VIFLIDGFNLYHSIMDINYHKGIHLKWLNIYGLCNSFLHLIDTRATLAKIYYFSAYAYHVKSPGVIKRHKDYIKCLESTGVEPVLGRFKPKIVTCSVCRHNFIKHEEKETDVAIATKLFQVLYERECETTVLVTGDTDIVPSIKTAKILFPDNDFLFAFPFGRKNNELVTIAPNSFKIGLNSYINHQFPDPFVLSNGDKISKPPSW
jgi:uncharacterized LabA/DUF88 family protein